jgi:hypothetical protein
MDGGESDDEDAPRAYRRDQPVPPSWVGEDYEPASPWIGRPVPRRPMSGRRLLVVAALVLFLVTQAVGLVIAYVDTPLVARTSLALGAVYLAIIEIAGWWTVGWLIARR